MPFPQTTISDPVQTAVLTTGGVELLVLMVDQLFTAKLYRPLRPAPPQMSMSVPVQTALKGPAVAGAGALVVSTADQVLAAASQTAPSFRKAPAWLTPPQTIICDPVQTAPWFLLAERAGV